MKGRVAQRWILSSKLPQRGQSNRGFHGFLPEDIKKEAARASRKAGQLENCISDKPETKSIYSPTDHFVRNIAQHRTSDGRMWGRKAVSCAVKTYPKQVLKTSRVRAVAKLSTTASAYRDAAWELEPGAFSELYQRYQHCDAPICVYEQGRDSFEDEG
ncbi:hypothetical protein J1605_022594 [Eschrichtius robustus]|uniref:Uncharacterized protein n=1 Tax=Eschrichtius robustus TaxID=9764 RepID=A0AB34H810_ESCRO|nr:hypothetical protein J1605_022594 [Eschrichtius robustus]